jgi:putative membrane protein
MKTIPFYFPLSLLFGMALISCHNGKTPENTSANKNDSMKASTNSAMTADIVDPSNAFPKPPVTGPQEDSSRTYDSTSWFIANALEQSQDNIVLADLAMKNASDKDIKKIASHVKNEHYALMKELQHKRIAISTTVRSKQDYSVAHRNIEMLQKLSGHEFDKNWTDAMIEQHQHMIKEYESILTHEPTKKIKTYIKDALPRLKGVLQELQSYSSIVYKT